MTHRAREAETTKNHVQLAKDRAQRLVDVIAADKAVAEQKLEAARPALEEAESALNTIKPAHIGNTKFKFTYRKGCNMVLLDDGNSHGAQTGPTAAIDYEDHGCRFGPVPASNPAHLPRTGHGRIQTVME